MAAVETAPTPPAGPVGPEERTISLTLHVWRQPGPGRPGAMVRYDAPDISTEMSFLEMLDVVNEGIIKGGGDPIAFDHDCREGICGMCGLMINGIAHGPQRATTVCQLHMRHFNDGDTVVIEPWRAEAFPVIKDLVVDRSAFDRIIESGGFVTANTGGAQDANSTPVPKPEADAAFDAAACIGCGACVAACPNGAAMLFTAAKVTHLGMLPQGQAERYRRVINMVTTMDSLGFGACTNIGECAAVCPKEISMDTIARMNRDLVKATMRRKRS
jgi:succinate dehydrogenase / fumarate reductase iron-sulfur subunit